MTINACTVYDSLENNSLCDYDNSRGVSTIKTTANLGKSTQGGKHNSHNKGGKTKEEPNVLDALMAILIDI